MCTLVKVAVLIVVLVLAVGLAGPAFVQAGAAPAPGEKEKLIDLMKAQMAMQRGEHELMHEVMDKLLKKYPNDPEIKALDDFHEKWHGRAKMQEEVQQRTQTFLESARD